MALKLTPINSCVFVKSVSPHLQIISLGLLPTAHRFVFYFLKIQTLTPHLLLLLCVVCVQQTKLPVYVLCCSCDRFWSFFLSESLFYGFPDIFPAVCFCHSAKYWFLYLLLSFRCLPSTPSKVLFTPQKKQILWFKYVAGFYFILFYFFQHNYCLLASVSYCFCVPSV